MSENEVADQSLARYVDKVIEQYRPLVNAEPGLLSALYDVDLLPEQLGHVLQVNPQAAGPNAARFALICELWKMRSPSQPATAASAPETIQQTSIGREG
jgi:hypothetical protein